MIKYRNQIPKKEKHEVELLLNDIQDTYTDFYITRDNLRLYIRENTHLLFECLQKGDKIVFSPDDGIIFITGWSDNAKRKYLKILAKSPASADKLLKVVNWNIKDTLYAKFKKNNPIIKSLRKNGFSFKGDRGKELLLCRKSKEIEETTDKGE